MRRILTVVITLVLLVGSAMPVSAYDEVSWAEYDEHGIGDTMTISNGKMQGIAHYLVGTHKYGQRYKGKGQCFGYAEKIRKMFGNKYKQKKVGKKFTKNNLYKALKGCKPGTHLRLSTTKNGGGRVHSIAVLKVTKDKIWFTDANMDHANGIRFGEDELQSFVWGHSQYKYIAWTRGPTGKVPTTKKMSASAYASNNGPATRVAWRPVKKAKSYIVYRSNNKNSGYKKIATVKSCSYNDCSTDYYGIAYYKVKAVITKNKSLTSKPTLAYRRLKAPKAYLTVKSDGNFEITIKPVQGATKYNIYVYDPSTGKYKKTVITGTSWTCKPKTMSLDCSFTAEGPRKGSESYRESICYYNF